MKTASIGFRPKSMAESNREIAADTAIPITVPNSIGLALSRSTSPSTCSCCAPSAIRMPISCVRSTTL